MKRACALIPSLAILLVLLAPLIAGAGVLDFCDPGSAHYRAWVRDTPSHDRIILCLTQERSWYALQKQDLERRNRAFAQRLAERERQLTAERRTAAGLRTTIARLDREKNELQAKANDLSAQLEKRSSELAEARREAAAEKKLSSEFETKNTSLESQLKEFSERVSFPRRWFWLAVIAILALAVVAAMVARGRGYRVVRSEEVVSRRPLDHEDVVDHRSNVARANERAEITRLQQEVEALKGQVNELKRQLEAQQKQLLYRGLQFKISDDEVRVVDTEVPHDEGKDLLFVCPGGTAHGSDAVIKPRHVREHLQKAHPIVQPESTASTA